MIFWTLAILLTFLAILAVILPLARAERVGESEIDYDKAMYRSRVEEIEKDRDLGRITPEAATAAISEEGRKLIALSKKDSSSVKTSGRKLAAGVAVASAAIIPAAALFLYFSFGSPGMPDQTLASRMNAAPEDQSISELVARAEAHLAANPDDARGWAVLAPVYSRLNRFEDATRAWANVYRISPDTPEIRATLAESMLAVSNGVVTDAAQKLFAEELAVNQSSAKARFYLAMALGQEGKHEEAIKAWDELIAGGTQQSPWMEAAVDFRSRSAQAIGDTSVAQIPGSSQPGPTREQIEAASEMTADDRNAMIRNMVSGLAERLEEDSSDKEGWLRLIRAYIVLGEREKAAAALDKATSALPDDQVFLASLNEFRAMLENQATAPAQGEGVSQ